MEQITDSSSLVPSQGMNKFLCSLCNITFSRKDNLHRHKKKFHSRDDTTAYQVCGVCNSKSRTIVDLQKHIEIEHPDVKLCFQDKVFYCQSDFDQWKDEIERETISSFLLTYRRTNGNSEYLFYKCHRSGPAKRSSKSQTGKKKRRFKHAGTIKTGITCPAMIKVTKETVEEITQLTVQYQSTHVGHQCEVGKLFLKKEERKMLADMLSSGVPIKVVTNKTRAQLSSTKRIDLITRQDIYNVARDFNVNSIAHHKDDAIAVDVTVKKMMEGIRENCVSTSPEDGHLVIDVTEKDISDSVEENIIPKQIRKKPQMDLNYKKLKIEKNWQSISNKMQALESVEGLQFIEDSLNNIQAYLDIIKKPELQNSESSKASPNKKICPQKKLKILERKQQKKYKFS